VNVRPAHPDDAPSVLAIYAPVVRETAISFEETVPTLDEVARRIQAAIAWFIVEEKGSVVGYAHAVQVKWPAAYRWSVEVTVYVDAQHRRKGVARVLLDALIADLQKRGFVNAFAGIALPNGASVGFFESLGFKNVGRLKRVGYKCGRWRDVGWWQLQLNEPQPDPPEPQGVGAGE
jgi:L-amino acid N-acyltransferase YncA